MNNLIQTISVYAIPVLFAITLHEAAHAYAAKYFGDSTAYVLGRVSFNPIKHIDPFGTILIPVLLYLSTGGTFLFGYAKPVPINFSNLRRPKRDMAWVALAGPAANFLMALIWLLILLSMSALQVEEDFFNLMSRAGILTNLVLFAFNLLLIPPLDGGRILISLLPDKYAYKFAQIEPYGFFIVVMLALLKLLYFWMSPVIAVAYAILQWIVWPLSFFLN